MQGVKLEQTVKGTSRKRRLMASSTLRKLGLWLPAIMNLCVGLKSKKSPRMKRPVEASGVAFVDENGEGPGVRLRKKR